MARRAVRPKMAGRNIRAWAALAFPARLPERGVPPERRRFLAQDHTGGNSQVISTNGNARPTPFSGHVRFVHRLEAIKDMTDYLEQQRAPCRRHNSGGGHQTARATGQRGKPVTVGISPDASRLP